MQDLESTTTFVANCSINPQVYAKINLINKPTNHIELPFKAVISKLVVANAGCIEIFVLRQLILPLHRN